ncbi:MAG: hypothetical protein LBC35_02685 [Coriobacteriales bacterium]|nr:hypothetical protein [Coriobacteriales bacterium]
MPTQDAVAPQARPAPQLKALPGKGLGARTRPDIQPWATTAAVMAAVVIAVLASVCVARIALSNLTVQMMLNGEQIANEITTARSMGLELEVRHSVATNPNRVQDAATKLGMLPDNQVATLAARQGFSPEVKSLLAQAAGDHMAAAVAQAEAEQEAARVVQEATRAAQEAEAVQAAQEADQAAIQAASVPVAKDTAPLQSAVALQSIPALQSAPTLCSSTVHVS